MFSPILGELGKVTTIRSMYLSSAQKSLFPKWACALAFITVSELSRITPPCAPLNLRNHPDLWNVVEAVRVDRHLEDWT
eukprot:CAMPEP_0181377970 /NCGR_PEP_ID=MMETSP1106-20121128/18194_1 /TAXON_ID=81844 /ORGANISM="Mantoniella antarctica, Strain SL-175" /LENGTH=78 /DNA_ID=CAMNT_0023496767 /DNA_START=67 /DNA_END=300 /DNA_ORIENTATION=+